MKAQRSLGTCTVSLEPFLLAHVKYRSELRHNKKMKSTRLWCMLNVLKIKHFSLSILKRNVGYQGWNSQNACRNSKQERPRSDFFFRSSLIWVRGVCLDLFCSQLMFKILERLPYPCLRESLRICRGGSRISGKGGSYV